MFTSNGIDVVTFDYRGFGESSEFEISNDMYIYPHFTDDVEAFVVKAHKNGVAVKIYKLNKLYFGADNFLQCYNDGM